MIKYQFLLFLSLFIVGRILLLKAINLCEKLGFKVKDSILAHIADHDVFICLKSNKENNQANKYYYFLIFFIFLEVIGWLIVIDFIFNG